jgi:hypothetical protein
MATFRWFAEYLDISENNQRKESNGEEGGLLQVDLNYPLHYYLSDNLAVYFHALYDNSQAAKLPKYQERTDDLCLELHLIFSEDYKSVFSPELHASICTRATARISY